MYYVQNGNANHQFIFHSFDNQRTVKQLKHKRKSVGMKKIPKDIS